MKIPTFNEVCEKKEADIQLNPLETFIWEDEPCKQDVAWRILLKKAIEYSIEESKGWKG